MCSKRNENKTGARTGGGNWNNYCLLITELPSTGKNSWSGEVLIHKCSSYSRRHRVVVFGLEPHTTQESFPSLSFPLQLCLEVAKVKGTDQTLHSRYSLSASDMIIFGLFPPSSRVTLLRLLSAAAFWIRCPTCRKSRAGVGINSHISKAWQGSEFTSQSTIQC